MIRLTVNSIFLIIISMTTLHGQTNKQRQIDSLMQFANQIGIFNGNILVAEQSKIIYNTSWGYADASKKSRLTTDYRFNIGSITKEFSAVAIMMLQEQGKLKLSDKVSKFFPELPNWADNVTIKNLLQYSSGLPDINWETIKSDKDVFNDLKKIDTLNFKAGTNYKYNNNNVLLRQFIVEHITGMSFNHFVEKYLFIPIKMKASIMNPTKTVQNIARSFNDNFVEDPTDLPISGIAFVTTKDLFQWTKRLHTEGVINKQSIYELGQSFKLGTNSGLGRATFENTILKEHQHDGQSRNYEALMYTDLQKHITIILLGNNKNEKLFDICTAIKAILAGDAYQMPKKSVSKYLDKYIKSLKIDELITFYTTLKATKSNELDFQSEDDLNTIGYELMNTNRLVDAIKIFILNTQQFPNSGNVFDSLGEAYMTKEDYKMALIAYKKSLELDPKNDNAKQMIEKIEKK